MAAGQDNPATDNWKDHLNNVDKLANTGGGDGLSWEDAIEIATAEELAYFAQQVNSQKPIAYGSSSSSIAHDDKGKEGGFKGYYFALTADIDLSGHYWTPIGNTTCPFKGNFDGRGHCVNGLKMMKVEIVTGAVNAGLFGKAYVGTLRNLGVRLADAGIQANSTDGSAYVGGIAGYAYKIFNSYVVGEGTIKASISGEGDNYTGGIVGYLDNDGSLTNCYATVNVKVESENWVYVGGIVGYGSASSTISCTYATGDVETGTGDYKHYAGGICGCLLSNGTLTNSLAVNGRIIGGNSYSNRIVGKKESSFTLTDNYASPEIQVNGNSVSDGADSDMNGNPEVNLENFRSIFTWGDGWNKGDGTHLPQLKIQTEDTDGNTTYLDWPTGDGYTSQPSLDATRYLIATGFDGGNGSLDNPYEIANRAQLAYLAKQVNDKKENDGKANGGKANGGKENGYESKYFILTADIDLSSYYWTPIGTVNNPFKGNFDGKGYCVKGLKVYVEGSDKYTVYAGLFGYTSTGTLCNLGVWLAKEGVHIVSLGSADAYAGGIAGQAKYIFNCYVTGEGEVEVGVEGEATSISKAEFKVGGIVGNITGDLSDCYATVDVKAGGKGSSNYAGGIAGKGSIDNTFSRTYATGAVEAVGSGYNYAGGICGSMSTEKTLSYNLALNSEITGDKKYSGRITGELSRASSSANYASTKTNCNFTEGNPNGSDGTPTYLETFLDDLKDNGWGENWDISDDGNLPKLKMKMENQDGISYESWPAGKQPSLLAEDYLSAFPKLHIVSPHRRNPDGKRPGRK
ncbi:GLUG motif-containing protein [Parabacteroides faecis]|uniref:GLUG motif-containing protein n=1 Tax=Parabacteroides faecis TaxID=1217282 RepID=UPI0021667F80|nr:GLUG motif-containing protein [Parabacteroides faecis]MCS2893899.1 hypothetical protein [Parabacteroides faecis]